MGPLKRQTENSHGKSDEKVEVDEQKEGQEEEAEVQKQEEKEEEKEDEEEGRRGYPKETVARLGVKYVFCQWQQLFYSERTVRRTTELQPSRVLSSTSSIHL